MLLRDMDVPTSKSTRASHFDEITILEKYMDSTMNPTLWHHLRIDLIDPPFADLAQAARHAA